ncbi:hypothetical protein C8J57DRAFT_1224423 [Mycena rebaudengoi]|nr:hypothetical protein C8J57DRAFT_1224423 [Mycena rebaudengoi]
MENLIKYLRTHLPASTSSHSRLTPPASPAFARLASFRIHVDSPPAPQDPWRRECACEGTNHDFLAPPVLATAPDRVHNNLARATLIGARVHHGGSTNRVCVARPRSPFGRSVTSGVRIRTTRAASTPVPAHPVARKAVGEVCEKFFGISFEIMLSRHPDYNKRRVPRYVPPPQIIVPAMEHVFKSYGNALDAKSGLPLFLKKTWQKANAVLELARQGYLSDIHGVQLFSKAGVDQHGLQKFRNGRGTNKVEGGPHGDIYRKFGALNEVADLPAAGPLLTVNSLSDHRTWFNLQRPHFYQANAKHVHNLDWNHHHSLALINRTLFLLNYLSGIVKGAESYSEWLNADLYEQTTEKFGICPVPGTNDWLRQRQGVALPILPPSTREAREYFFKKNRELATVAAHDGRRTVDYAAFAREWNRSADGKTRHYVTTSEVLTYYAKSWQKHNNSRASQELISKQLEVVASTREVFVASHLPLPSFLTGRICSTIERPVGNPRQRNCSAFAFHLSCNIKTS